MCVKYNVQVAKLCIFAFISFPQLQVLNFKGIYGVDENGDFCAISPSSSSHLASFICQIPSLTQLTIGDIHVSDDFYSTASSLAPPMKVRM